MIVKIKKNNHILGENIKLADTFYSRLVGLMFIKKMENMDGIFFDNCRAIHNSFVRFPIDVIFMSHDNKVVKVIHSFKPWRWSLVYFKASRVLELPANTIPKNLDVGDQLEVFGV